MNTPLAYYLVGGLSMLVAATILLAPETTGEPLPQTVADAESIGVQKTVSVPGLKKAGGGMGRRGSALLAAGRLAIDGFTAGPFSHVAPATAVAYAVSHSAAVLAKLQRNFGDTNAKKEKGSDTKC